MAVPWTLLTMLSLVELGNALKSTTRPVVLPLQRPQRHVERHGITMASGSRVAGTICSSRQMRDLASREFSLAAGQSDVGVVHLKDLSSTEYVGVLGVGSNCSGGPCRPAAELYVVYDTGSADLWVASDLCTAGPCTRDGCHRFNRSTSSTFQQDQHPDEFQTDYASGRLAGVLGRDQVWVGPYAAQSALGLISEESGSAFSWMPIDGIVGLGFEALSVKTKPLMDSLLQENALPLSEFAFFLYKDVSKGGVMIWGNAQQLQLHQEPLQWFPVAQEKYWSLLLRGFRLGRNSTNDLLHLLFPPKKRREDGPLLQTTEEMQVEEMPSAHLLMDSGTTFFTAPPRLFNEISRFIWPSSCHHLQRFPELVFTVGTDLTNHSALAELVIPPEVYMVRSPFDHSCVPGIMNLAASPEDPPMMILGEVFMRHRFSIYRRGRVQGDSWVGWAPAKPDADVEALLR